MVATRVFPSPVAISAAFPWCSAIPPMSCTSYGIMSHVARVPVNVISCPIRRRVASFTVANASGSSSSSTSPVVAFRRSSVSLISRFRRSRSPASSVFRFVSRSVASSSSSACVRSRMMPRNFSVCAFSSSSETDWSRSAWPLISSTSGWSYATSRS